MQEHADTYAAAEGETNPDLQTHIESCPSCREEVDETRSLLSLLETLPEIEPSPEVWSRIETNIARRARVRKLAFWIPTAAAATLLMGLLAVSMFATRPTDRLAATVSSASPGTGIAPGTRIDVGDSFHSPAYATLALPDIGTLKLNRDTRIRFESRRRVEVLQGELFADIRPGSGGFEVACGGSTVTVHGTRFGVRCAEAVYVVEGAVSVAGPAGRMTLAANEAATLQPERLPLGRVQAYLRWLHTMDQPALVLRVRPRGASVVSTGKALEIDVVLSANAPVLADDPRNPNHYLILLGKSPSGRPYSMSLDPTRPIEARIPAGANGRIILDVHQEAVLTYRLDPALFQDGGTHTVSVAYYAQSGQEAVSEPFPVEVRP